MKRTFLPRSRSARTTKSTVIISRKFPIWTVPDGVIPEAHVYESRSPFCLMIRSACWSAQWQSSFGFRSDIVFLL